MSKNEFQPNLTRSEMLRLTWMLEAGVPFPDEVLLKELKEKKVLIDVEFFKMCLTGRFPKSTKYLIQTDPDKSQLETNLSEREMSSIMFEMKEEEVII